MQTKKIVKGTPELIAKSKPLAVSLMFERLWAVYEAGTLSASTCRWARALAACHLLLLDGNLTLGHAVCTSRGASKFGDLVCSVRCT